MSLRGVNSVYNNPTFTGLIKGVPFTLDQTAIACMVPSSGTIGDNGALTLTTALPSGTSLQYSGGAYLYFPAGKVYSGSAAGLYFTIMSSTTLGTIYDNIYDPSLGLLPTIPGTPTPIVATGPGAYTQTTASAITLIGLTIPGNYIGPNGRLTLLGSIETPSSAGTKVVKAAYSTSRIFNLSITTNNARQQLIKTMRNRGVTNKQFVDGYSSANLANSTNDTDAFAIDTTADQLLSVTTTNSADTDYTIVDSFEVVIAYKA